MIAKKILIAEDERIIARDLKINLEQMGYMVTSMVDSGEDAIIHAEKENPDLVLMDIMLKGKIDGIDAAKKIRVLYNIPIIYLTAFADEQTLQRAKITEPYAYILKPFNSRELHSSIEMAIYKHQTEQKLKESKELLSTTLNSITDAVISTDDKGKVTYMNPLAEELTGWKLNEAEGKELIEIFNIVNSQTKEIVENPVKMILETGSVIGLANNTMLISKVGKECQIAESGAPINDSVGNIVGIVLVFRDVSKEFGMQKALKENENNLRVLFNAMTDIVVEMDYNGTYLNIAPTSPDHMFKPSKESIGKTLHDIFPKPEADRFLVFIRKCLDENKNITIEYPLVIKDKTRWFQGRATPKTKNRVFYMATDITEHKLAEETIKEQLHYSKALNKIAKVIDSENDPNIILETTATIVGESLETDRALIYNIEFNEEKIIGLCEWLNNKKHKISPTLSTFDLAVFVGGANLLWKSRSFVESHYDDIASALLQDGSGELLHNQMQIKSGLWMPFNFRDDGFHILVFNQVLYRRNWQKKELDFIESVTGQISFALQKIKFLDELKKTGLDLKSSESKYRLLAENAVDFFFHLDLKFKFKYLSPYLYDSLGYDPEKLIGTRLYKYLSRKEFIKVVRISSKAVLNHKTNPVVLFKTKLIHKKGHEVPVEISGKVLLNEKGRPIGLQGSVRDISERYKTEEALRASEEKWRTLTENSSDHIILLDSDYIIRFINHTTGGLKRDQVVGKSNFHFLPKEYHKIAKDCFDKVYRTGKPDRFETKYIEVDGSTLFFDVRISPLIDKYGDVAGLINTSSNITKRMMAEKEREELNEKLLIQNDELTESVNRIQQINTELEKALDRAEESDRLKSSFLANMSHEIRTPMNGILGFASLLKERSLSGEEQQKYIGIIENSGQRMLNIINDLINISKIESGQTKVFLSETNINEQINYIYTFFKPEAEKKGIKFSTHNILPHAESIVKTDKEKIYAILSNLVKNAIKYTEEGNIEIGYNVKAGKGQAELEFYVTDTGIGIARNKQKLIFDRFVQADLSLSSNYEGAGLGLSISKAFVEMLNGKIGVESEKGRGSRFFFTIPYLTNTLEQSDLQNENNKSTKNTQLKKLNILITEDEQTSRTYLSLIVKDIGEKILFAENGLEAIQLCKKTNDIDLILMDIKMPEMDGFDATTIIRKFNKDVIIIAQTAYALSTDREKALKLGCNDFISKPILKEDLLAVIAKYF